MREGLTCVLSIKVREPQFEGQTKTKLGNSEVEGIVKSVVNEGLSTYLEEHPSVARAVIDKACSAALAREAARKARELVRRKSALEGGVLPGKLADCSLQDPAPCADRQDPLERGDPDNHHLPRHGGLRGLQDRGGALPQDHHHD